MIGLTLWGAPLPQSDLNNFATATHDITVTATGVYSGTKPTGTAPDQIDWVYTNGADTSTNVQNETAMDVEYAHGMAPHSHLVYYLGDTLADGISGDEVGLANAISLAANNSLIHVVSNSWGGADITGLSDPFASSTDPSLAHAVAVGTTFFFSTGDLGSDPSSSTARQAQYPASSPYVVAVGGTTLQTDGNDRFQGETVWSTCGAGSNCSGMEGAGAGCSAYYAQPAWENTAAVRAEEIKEKVSPITTVDCQALRARCLGRCRPEYRRRRLCLWIAFRDRRYQPGDTVMDGNGCHGQRLCAVDWPAVKRAGLGGAGNLRCGVIFSHLPVGFPRRDTGRDERPRKVSSRYWLGRGDRLG